MKGWLALIKERFDPLSHALMIGCFVMVHLALSSAVLSVVQVLLLALASGTFFFKLRLYDELKDYELDCQINPSRPLVRGVLTRESVRLGILVAILVELACLGAFGWSGFCAMIFTIGYSLLMYNEFFIRERIRPLLTTYAATHTIVCSLMSLTLFSAATGLLPWQLPRDLYMFSFGCWFIFNVFEFGRKTFASAEERPNVDSYSGVWGRAGAVVLLLSMVLVAAWCILGIARIQGPFLSFGVAGITATVATAGLFFAVANTPASARIYRGITLSYIVLIQVLVIAAYYLAS